MLKYYDKRAVAEKNKYALEEKIYCIGVFVDVSQAFDRVWHSVLLYKIKLLFLSNYYLLLNI